MLSLSTTIDFACNALGLDATQVSVLLAGRHVQGSPFLVKVQAAQLCPQSCQLLGMTDKKTSSGDTSI